MGRKHLSPVAWTLELVIVIAAAAAFGVWLMSDRGGFDRAQEAADCGAVVTDTCVESRAGEFNAHGKGLGSTSARYRRQVFTDTEGDRQAFDMRLSRHAARQFDGTDVRGLYYDGNLVGVQTESGKRYWGIPGWRGIPPRSSMAVIGGLLALIGGCAAALALTRRR